MNIIEAWEKAKEGQLISCSTGRVISKQKKIKQSLVNLYEEDIVANDWVIIKEKKRVEIEGVFWMWRTYAESGHFKASVFYPQTETGIDWKQFLNKPKMKMILEWED